MQPCSPVLKARRFWRVRRASSVSERVPGRWMLRRQRGRCARREHNETGRELGVGIGMAETTEKTGEKKLSVTPSKPLSLKGRGVEQGVVRQSFSHGRTKAVVVEKVKSRAPVRTRAEPAATRAPSKRPASAKMTAAAAPAAAPAPPAPKPSGGLVLRSLTEEEQKARVHALNDARLREAEERKIAEEEALVRKSREEAERSEREAAEA